jgi:hypothetical protein
MIVTVLWVLLVRDFSPVVMAGSQFAERILYTILLASHSLNSVPVVVADVISITCWSAAVAINTNNSVFKTSFVVATQ